MNNEEQEIPQYTERTNAFKTLVDEVYIHRLPSYGNKIFFSLGFLTLTCLVVLAITGITMAFMGQAWWLHNSWGIYVRSVHLWTVQAFIVMLILHMLVAFVTSGFRAPRRMVWVFGAIIFSLVLIQTEFGYGLRGDFSSQFRAVSGADFWNGAYLGYWLNPLNYLQTFVIHTAIIPLAIFLIFIVHYVLEHAYGISRPYRKDLSYKTVPANHTKLFIRGGVLIVAILTLAFFFHSPYVPAVRIADVAQQNPDLVKTTLLQEFERTSDTATYVDSIDPYRFDTRNVFVVSPYEHYAADNKNSDAWNIFQNESAAMQQSDIGQAEAYVVATDTGEFASSTNPVIVMLRTLMPMAASGSYESLVAEENPSINNTYTLRFLSDMDIPETKATSLNMSTAQSGMIKDETNGALPPGSWWLFPLAAINKLFNLPASPYGDRDAAEILGGVMLLFILFPYIPYINRLPEALNLGPLIWGKPDAPEGDQKV